MSFDPNDKGDASFSANKAPAREAARFKKLLGTHVQISRHKIPIVLVIDLVVDGGECCGCYDLANRIIYIDIRKDDPVATLFHEIGHAEIIEGGLRQHPKWCHELEEIVVELFSKCVAFNFSCRPRQK